MLTRQRLVGSDLGWMMDFPRYFVDATGSSALPWQEAVAQDGLPEVLSVPTGRGKTVARHLGVSHDTVDRWIDGKGLPAHKLGRLWKFKLAEIADWVRSGGAQDADDQGSP